jgi:hypothetical protein
MSETDLDDEDVGCHHSGQCVAAADDRGLSNCIYCGKELREKGGEWWTWDADQYSDPKPQAQDSSPKHL